MLWVLYYFIKPRVQDSYYADDRMWVFGLFAITHVVLNGVVLFLEAFGLQDEEQAIQYRVQNTVQGCCNLEGVKLKHVMRVVRHVNLWLFCVLIFSFIYTTNNSNGHLLMNSKLNIFDKNECQQMPSAQLVPGEMPTAQLPPKCSLGFAYSNLYNQGSSVYFKSIYDMHARVASLVLQAAQDGSGTGTGAGSGVTT